MNKKTHDKRLIINNKNLLTLEKYVDYENMITLIRLFTLGKNFDCENMII